MIPKFLKEQAEGEGVKLLYNGGALQSIDPPETLFGYTVWSHLIPPFKPEHTLMLGYGGGTTHELMRKIWGSQLKVTAIDIEPTNFINTLHKFKNMDAKDFIWDETKAAFKDYIFPKAKYDYVCIDLWNGDKVPDFIFDVEFAVRLRELATGLVSMNIR